MDLYADDDDDWMMQRTWIKDAEIVNYPHYSNEDDIEESDPSDIDEEENVVNYSFEDENEEPDPRDVDDEESDHEENDQSSGKKQNQKREKDLLNREFDILLDEIKRNIRFHQKKPRVLKQGTYCEIKTENNTSVSESQKVTAKELFELMTGKEKKPPKNFKFFDFYIIVPLFKNLGKNRYLEY